MTLNTTLKRIHHYDSAYELLFNEVYLDQHFTGDEVEILEHLDDFESFSYTVFVDDAGHRSVLLSDALSGDIFSVQDMNTFTSETAAFIRKEME